MRAAADPAHFVWCVFLKAHGGLARRKEPKKMGENFLKVPELREALVPLSVLSLDLDASRR
jgi:hypothetical protein